MKIKRTLGERIFNVFNYTYMLFLSLICILPLVHVLAISLSNKAVVDAGRVTLIPIGFNLESYKYILTKPEFIRAFTITLKRLALGISINMLLTIMTAYPLSKEVKAFKHRTFIVWYFIITMLFGGGLIPFYMTVKATKLMDTVWALVIPGAVPIYNVVLMLNFFRSLPKELEESAMIDGAGHWTILWKIYVPVSTAGIATITLFTAVGHWNAWFDGLILMNKPENYPLQSYLQTVILGLTTMLGTTSIAEDWKVLQVISDRTVKSSQIFLGALPIILVYPFLQRYFIKGIVLGSVKQ
ncbi:MAG: carbohydrate ABC transporter permease [Firmicutes bacterium]|nr:carbohydrate ABC transporter permease [Bacillota bacterium]